MAKKLIVAALSLVVLLALVMLTVTEGWLAAHEGPGTITELRVPEEIVTDRVAEQAAAISAIGENASKQILFGDLHVHTTLSFDAFLGSLPMMNGEGTHPLADACDFARYCSALDFWSINDHAEALTPRRWKETIASIQQCNAVGGNGPTPDTVAFLGWEWTQVGSLPENHYGHKNVIFLETDADKVPTRPIHSGGMARMALQGLSAKRSLQLVALDPNKRMLEFARYLQELRQTKECEPGLSERDMPADCGEGATTPDQLFAKLNDWGFESMVIPHGTTWGYYTPPGSTWDKQLAGDLYNPDQQFLLEIFSGHGNSEQYRDFRGAEFNADGQPVCPEPSANYLPSCYRAGQIIEERCLLTGAEKDDCAHRAANARQDYTNLSLAGHLAVSGESTADWLDAGQCRDCYLPSFNYRPGGSAQYITAITNFDDPANPRRFRFGFMASSDNHRARPGTGYKEFFRRGMADPTGPAGPKGARAFLVAQGEPLPYSEAVDVGRALMSSVTIDLIKTDSPTRKIDVPPLLLTEAERQASFFTTGGLIAVHSQSRQREDIWQAMQAKEVYATSGDRILLWFDLLNAPGGNTVVMGGDVQMDNAPQFEVRAMGAFEQLPGCPDYSINNLTPEKLEYVCRGECYNPSDTRKIISRIEVVRILPQATPGEDVRKLIQDPWKTLDCEANQLGCTVTFSDEEYAGLARDAVYYVRAIEEPGMTVNADQLRCEYDENGNCIKVNPCYADWRTDPNDDCLGTSEERAWSSPIFVDWKKTEPGQQTTSLN